MNPCESCPTYRGCQQCPTIAAARQAGAVSEHVEPATPKPRRMRYWIAVYVASASLVGAFFATIVVVASRL